MTFTTLFIDLDDTLYPPEKGVWDAIGEKINEYMETRVGIAAEDVPTLRESLYRTYGTTLRGLMITRGIDPVDYLKFVHDIPLKKFLHPAPEIRQILLKYPLRKIILTNADRNHALRVLKVLELDGVFEQIIDIMDMLPYCKPLPEAFKKALEKAGSPQATECIYLDDNVSNLRAAKALGFYTIHVHPAIICTECHNHIPYLQHLPQVLDPLLSEDHRS